VCLVGTGIITDSVLRQHRHLPSLLLCSPCLIVRRRCNALAARDPPTLSVDSGRPYRHSVRPASCRAGSRCIWRPCRGAGWLYRCRCLPAMFRVAAARRQRRLRCGHRRLAPAPRTCLGQRARTLQTRLERPAVPLDARRKLQPDVQSNDRRRRFRFAECCSVE